MQLSFSPKVTYLRCRALPRLAGAGFFVLPGQLRHLSSHLAQKAAGNPAFSLSDFSSFPRAGSCLNAAGINNIEIAGLSEPKTIFNGLRMGVGLSPGEVQIWNDTAVTRQGGTLSLLGIRTAIESFQRYQTLQPAHEQLQQNSANSITREQMQIFLGNFCHDLNNALSGPMGYADLLRQMQLPGKAPSYAGHIIASLDRAAGFVRLVQHAQEQGIFDFKAAKVGPGSTDYAALKSLRQAASGTGFARIFLGPDHRRRLKCIERILVLDDEPEILEQTRVILREMRFKARDITTVSSGNAAVEHGGKGAASFDIIFLDFDLPESNGFEVFQGIRQAFERTGLQQTEVPLVLCSSRAEELAGEAHKLGFAGVISKPLTIEVLQKFLADVHRSWNISGP